jgi:hypothetical protein
MNYQNLVLGTLSNDAFVMVNKKLAKKLGFIEAGLLGELISTFRYAKQENAFYKDEWFYLTQPTVEERLGIKRREHDTAIKNLVKIGIIDKKQMGLPAKGYYFIHWHNIVQLFEENTPQGAPQSDCTKRTNKDVQIVQPSMDETYKLDSTFCTPIITSNKKDIIKTNNKNNKTLLTKNDLINICNSFYSTYSVGRWSKKQWTTLIEKYVTETDWNEVAFPNSFIEGSIKGMARHFDYREGKILYPFDKDGIDYLDSEGKVPFYNWLEE